MASEAVEMGLVDTAPTAQRCGMLELTLVLHIAWGFRDHDCSSTLAVRSAVGGALAAGSYEVLRGARVDIPAAAVRVVIDSHVAAQRLLNCGGHHHSHDGRRQQQPHHVWIVDLWILVVYRSS